METDKAEITMDCDQDTVVARILVSTEWHVFSALLA